MLYSTTTNARVRETVSFALLKPLIGLLNERYSELSTFPPLSRNVKPLLVDL